MNFKVFDLGLVDFKKAWDFQKEIFTQVKSGYLESALILCQHHPVITLGRSVQAENNILVSRQNLTQRKIALYAIERGGDVTYHGPGQITAYPIFNLKFFKKDIHLFLRYLEKVIVDSLFDFGIKAKTYPGLTGVWINKRQKIASIGIAIKNWITFHGFSLNIESNDLENFRFIKACGMDIEMVSLETILNRPTEINLIKEKIAQNLRRKING